MDDVIFAILSLLSDLCEFYVECKVRDWFNDRRKR